MRNPLINVLFIFMLLLFFNCTKDIASIPEDIEINNFCLERYELVLLLAIRRT